MSREVSLVGPGDVVRHVRLGWTATVVRVWKNSGVDIITVDKTPEGDGPNDTSFTAEWLVLDD